MIAHGHDPAGQADGTERLQLRVGRSVEPLGELTRPVRHRIAAAERIDVAGAERLELLAALTDDVVLVALGHALPRADSR